MSEQLVQMIAVTSIIAGDNGRSVDDRHAKIIARTVPPDGQLLQPIGVVTEGDKYRMVWGCHRLRAYQLLGRKDIPARVLPAGTSSEDEARYSLLENSVHRVESFEDTLFRVEELARRMNCTLAKAAEAAEVKPSYLSRCKAASRKLSPEAKAFAKEHNFGISDVYLVATKAPKDKQLQSFQARLNGTSRDELARWLRVQNSSTRSKSKRSKKITLKHAIRGTQIRLTASDNVKCEQIAEQLAELSNLFAQHKDQSIQVFESNFQSV